MELTDVEDRAIIFFNESKTFPHNLWRDQPEGIKQSWKRLARKSLQLEVEAVKKAVKQITEERDKLKAKLDEIEQLVRAE
jgi:hypothetical protein